MPDARSLLARNARSLLARACDTPLLGLLAPLLLQARARAWNTHSWRDLRDRNTRCTACGATWRAVRRSGAPCAGPGAGQGA